MSNTNPNKNRNVTGWGEQREPQQKLQRDRQRLTNA
jgi:hypothetical protein